MFLFVRGRSGCGWWLVRLFGVARSFGKFPTSPAVDVVVAASLGVFFHFHLHSMKILSSPLFLKCAKEITRKESELSFRAHFGGPSLAVHFLWQCIVATVVPLPHLWGVPELLQTLCFLKSPGSNLLVTASRFGCDHRTLMKNVETTLHLINQTLPEVSLPFCLFHFLSFHMRLWHGTDLLWKLHLHF